MDPSTSYFDEVEAALGEYQRAGYQLAITAQFVLLCSALLTRNEPEAALDTIDRGLSIMTRNDERCLEAELYRLKARALLARGASDAKVAALLDQAVQTARRQHARSLELRAGIDLARLLMNKGKHAEALNLLGPVYGRFTEGFDTQDLKNAQALLAELNCEAKTLDNHAKERNN